MCMNIDFHFTVNQHFSFHRLKIETTLNAICFGFIGLDFLFLIVLIIQMTRAWGEAWQIQKTFWLFCFTFFHFGPSPISLTQTPWEAFSRQSLWIFIPQSIFFVKNKTIFNSPVHLYPCFPKGDLTNPLQKAQKVGVRNLVSSKWCEFLSTNDSLVNLHAWVILNSENNKERVFFLKK